MPDSSSHPTDPGPEILSEAREIFMESPYATFLVDERGRILQVNRAAEEQSGWGREDLLGRTVADLAVEEEVETGRRMVDQALKAPLLVETRYRRPEGGSHPVEIRTRPLEMDGRRCFLLSARDISAHEAIVRELRLQSDALENSLNGFTITDERGRLLYANRACLQMWGIEGLEQVLGTAPWDYYRDPVVLRELFEVLQERGEAIAELEARRRDGSLFDVLFYCRASTQETGRRVYLTTYIDITAQKRLERAQRQLFDSMLDGFALHGVLEDENGGPTDYRFLDVNPAFEALTGLAPEEVLGRTVREIWPGIGREWTQNYSKVVTTGEPVSFEAFSQALKRWYRVSAYRPEPGRLACLFNDVTEQHELRESLLQAQKMEAVGQLAGGVAHDFNNLLQVIHGYADLAVGDLAEDHPARQPVQEIVRAGQRASQLVRQLLAFSRKQILQTRVLDPNEVVTGVLQLIGRTLGEHIELSFAPGETTGSVRADRGQLEQVLMNLCVNARDAMPAGGRLEIRTRALEVVEGTEPPCRGVGPGAWVVFSVHDTGCGMEAPILDRIFEPFFTTKEQGKGTGLGLATVYGIVRQHGGVISVRSEVGRGTVFEVYLPAAEEIRPASRRSEQEALGLGGGERILVAEDDVAVRRLLVDLLRRAGYEVHAAADGSEACGFARERAAEIDLALLDVIMPGANGSEVLGVLRERRPDLPVIFLSGYSTEEIRAGLEADASVRLVQKPYAPADLLRGVRSALDSRN